MRTSFLVSALALFSSAAAQFDPDQCGPQAGNRKCSGSQCCSKYGWCGTSNAYCRIALGCQPGFGTCKGTASSSAAIGGATPSRPVPVGTSTDKCGSANGLICASGYCCSEYGYCGKTSAYCSTGCQVGFGTCNAVSTPSSSAAAVASPPSAPVSKNGRCGSGFNGQTCQGSTYGSCCSKYNYCGATNDHCKVSSGCQSGFGTCSGVVSSSSVVRSSSSSASIINAPSASVSSSTGPSSSSVSTLTSSSSSDSNARSILPSSSSVLLSSLGSSTPSPSSAAVPSTDVSQSSTPSPSPSSSLTSSAMSLSTTSVAASSSNIATSASSTSSAISSSNPSSSLGTSSAVSSNAASPSASDPSITSSSSSMASSSIVDSSTQPSPSASSTPLPTSNDPLAHPAAVSIMKSNNVQESVVNDPAGAPPGSTSGSYLTLVTTDGNGASMTVTTQGPSVQSGNRYTVSVWLKSTTAQSTCSVEIVVGSETIGTSGSPIPMTWTPYTASFVASDNVSPRISLAVTCPIATIVERRHVQSRQTTGSGLSMGGLSTTPSTDTTPTGCVPNIIDGGFEKFTSGVSDDWTTATGAVTEWNGNTDRGPAYAGPVNSTYNALTANTGATSYDIKYKHPLTLCAGVAYDVSGFARTQQASRSAYNQEGCTLSAWLNGQQAWTDRIGYWDYPQYRYLHGTVTPVADTSTAELFFRVNCKVPQMNKGARARGIKLDQVAVVPVSQWTLPPAAKPTPVTATGTTLQSAFPTPTLCYLQTVTYPRVGCVTEFEQFPNGGFELCADKEWWIQNATSGYGYDSETFPFNRTTTLSVSDDVVSGTKALRLVLNDDVTDNHARLISERSVQVCAERSYAWSFWVKQGKNLACTVSITIGNAVRGTWTPTQTWQKFEGRIDVSPVGTLMTSGYTYLSIDCTTGGMDGAVWFDDISLKQVPYQGP